MLTRAKSGYWRRELHMTSTDLDVLERFLEIMGTGGIEGPFKRGPAHWKPQWRWLCRRWPETKQTLEAMLPYLCRRRREKAIEMLNNPAQPVGKAHTFKTHCKNGHPLSGENLRITTQGNRECKVCGDQLRREWQRRKRAEQKAAQEAA